MPKGHSTLEPRIKALEDLLKMLITEGKIYSLDAQADSLHVHEHRIAALERRIAQMNDAFSRGNLPAPAGHQSTALQ